MITFGLVSADQLEDAIRIENQGFPEDEAGSRSFRFRQSQAPELFLGAFIDSGKGDQKTLVGYICGTLSPSPTLTHDSIFAHVPSASFVCIHSVCVAPAHRNQRIATNLLEEYKRRLRDAKKEDEEREGRYERIVLICHDNLRGWYESRGFSFDGLSNVVHGPKPWLQMSCVLHPSNSINVMVPGPSPTDEQGQLPPNLLEALQRASTRKPAPSQTLSSFSDGIKSVVSSSGADGTERNKHDLVCPQERCGSIILKSNVAEWVDRATVQLDPPSLPPNPVLGPLPKPPATTKWWLIKPSPMAFENVGFSRPVGDLLSENGRKVKYLACAECDLGALGWCEEGGREFWLAASRVRYQV